MSKVLTVKSVEGAKPKAVRAEIPDGGLPGLYLIVQPSGAKSWAYRYRFEGRAKKYTLGAFPAISLNDARKLAGLAARSAAEGRDPAEEKKVARRPGEAGLTIAELAATFLERHAKQHTRETTWRETARIFEKEVLPKWRTRRAAGITRGDVLELLDAIVDRGSPVLANRVLAAIRKMFSWAVSRDLIGASPCTGVKPPAAETERDRVLTDAELRALLVVCHREGWPFGPFVLLLVLTGQRLNEVARMRWSELDLETRTWRLPAPRAKNGEAHVIPLSEAVLAVLTALPRPETAKDFVFTTNGETPVSGFSRAKSRLDAAMSKELGAEVTPWVFHDLRRTAATGMGRLKIGLPIIEKILNHVSGTFAGIVSIYQRYSFFDEKLEALEAWGRFVTELPQARPVPGLRAQEMQAGMPSPR